MVPPTGYRALSHQSSMETNMSTSQSHGGNLSNEVPSFQVILDGVKLTLKANQPKAFIIQTEQKTSFWLKSDLVSSSHGPSPAPVPRPQAGRSHGLTRSMDSGSFQALGKFSPGVLGFHVWPKLTVGKLTLMTHALIVVMAQSRLTHKSTLTPNIT